MATKTIIRLSDQNSGFLTGASASTTYATKAELSTTNSELDSLESTVGSLPSIPIGVIMPFAGASNAPYGWEFCYGQELSISAYGGLYNTLTGSGTSFPYGANTNGSGGAGSTHFRVPDFRGRIPAGLDNMGGSAAGRLTTLSSSAIGATGGSQTVTTSNHSHNHIYIV